MIQIRITLTHMQLASDCEGSCSFGPFRVPNIDELVTSLERLFSVIPANPGSMISGAGAGIQLIQNVLDPGVRRGDDQRDFYDSVNIGNFGFRICLGFGYWLLEFRRITVSPDRQNLSGCSTKSGGFSEN